MPGVEGSPLDPGDIWLVVILACTNQTSIWETCKDTDGTPCDDTVLTWLHTLNQQWLEVVANLPLARLANCRDTGQSHVWLYISSGVESEPTGARSGESY